MPDDARMTLKSKMLRGLVASVAGASAALAASGGGLPGSASSCQRAIAIDPQVTVSELNRVANIEVHTNACAQAGSVSYLVVLNGTATRPGDFILDNGILNWQAGDITSRRITASIQNDGAEELAIEDFSIVLVNPSPTIRVASGRNQVRILDDDRPGSAGVIDDRICLISGQGSCKPERSSGDKFPYTGPTTILTFEPGHPIIPFSIDAPNPTDQWVTFDTFSGGLVEGDDFLGVHGPVLVPAGVTTVYVQVKLLPPAFGKPGQSLYTQVSGYTAGVILDPQNTVTMVA